MDESGEPVKVAMIVAMAADQVIGRNNQLPWHLPDDLRYFKAKTIGKPVIMGRKTYESIGRPLPGRTNIVVTHNQSFVAEGVRVVFSVEQAIAEAESVARTDGVNEIMVIGGAGLYEQCLPKTQRMYITEVDVEVDGDAFFPPVQWSQWQEVNRHTLTPESPDELGCSFVIYDLKV